MPANHALVDDPLMAVLHLDPDRNHQPQAGRFPVSWAGIHVLAMKTLRAMVRIAIPYHLRPTVLADEVLNRPLEFFHNLIS